MDYQTFSPWETGKEIWSAVDELAREAFYRGKLSAWDQSMQWNMGGGLPIIGFYEMKQDVYDIAARLNNLKLALPAIEKAKNKKDDRNISV